jgi:hypothetical protein
MGQTGRRVWRAVLSVVATIREETRREPRLPGIFRLVP